MNPVWNQIKSRAVSFWRMIIWMWNFREFEARVIQWQEVDRTEQKRLNDLLRSRHEEYQDKIKQLKQKHSDELRSQEAAWNLRRVFNGLGIEIDETCIGFSTQQEGGWIGCQTVDLLFTKGDEQFGYHIVCIEIPQVKEES